MNTIQTFFRFCRTLFQLFQRKKLIMNPLAFAVRKLIFFIRILQQKSHHTRSTTTPIFSVFRGIIQRCTPPEKNAHPPTFREKVLGGKYKQALGRPLFNPPRACYRSMVFTKPAKWGFLQKETAHRSIRCGIKIGVQFWWRRGESNSRPKTYSSSFLRAQPVV